MWSSTVVVFLLIATIWEKNWVLTYHTVTEEKDTEKAEHKRQVTRSILPHVCLLDQV